MNGFGRLRQFAAYDAQARTLAGMFKDTFTPFAADAAPDVRVAGSR